MSFVFPKPPPPPPKPRYNFSDVDYAELLLRLSIFGFSKLSVSDQQDKTEEMREKVVEDVIVEQLPKESDEGFRLRMFTDLFKKLPIAEQNVFLSSVVKIFKRHRRFDDLTSWFKQLGARDQQEQIENIVPAVAPKNLSFPGETLEDFRLRRFMQLSAVYTDYVYHKFLVTWGHHAKGLQIPKGSGSDEEDNSDGRSDEDSPEASGDDDDECSVKGTNELTYENKDIDQDNVVKTSRFAEFFLGFSIVWFEGENRDNQRRLIDQLCDGVKGVIIEKLSNESKEEFELRKFTELCKKVVDFVIQERFLDFAEKILWKETCRSLPHGKLLQPQDSASAADLCMRLTSFGFGLLPTVDQRHKVKEISESVLGGVKKMKRLANESSAEFRMRKFKELSPSWMHFSMFKEFTKKFFCQRQLHESISIFKQLGSKDQQDLIEKMFERLMVMAGSHQYVNQEMTSSLDDIQDEYDEDAEYMASVEIQDIIVERFTDESEENFRLRRFVTLYSKHPILCKIFLGRTEAGNCDRKGTLVHSSNNDQEMEEIREYRYAEFYLGLSVIWFKARCANISRNPIQVLFGKVEADRLIEKLPDESEEDFKLRRFTVSVKQLPFSSQEKLVKYIRKTLSYDIGEKFRHYRPYKQSFGRGSSRYPQQQYTPQISFPQGSVSFYPEFIKVRNPNPRGNPPIKTTNGSEGATAN